CLSHREGRIETLLLPRQRALDHPSEDRSIFFLQALGEVEIHDRGLDGEGHEVEATTHGVIEAHDARAVVARENELALREVAEEVLPHEAGADRIAAGDALHLRLIPRPAFLRLLRRHESR